ncbi:MAG: sulfatase-like hydrolase/transferase, partial [Vallitalea sp.]|nr:sulfatase-like hydrolase/transferase [Vallitalea sp.]
HNGTESYTRSFTEGKAVYFGGMWDHWNVPACDYNEEGIYPSRTVCKSPYTENKVMKDYVEYMEFGKHSTDLFGGVAKEFINNYDGEDPFFMYLSFMAPHDPRTMPKKFLDMYDDVEISLPNNFAEEHVFDYGIRDLRDEVLAPYPRTAEDTKNQIKEYYAMITHIDYQIGNVIEALKEKGELDNTIIIFSGDNGLALGQHGLFGKQNGYEHSIRVPLIFAGQDIPQGQTRDSYVYLLDIFPTICEMLGIDIPETVEGKSMLSAINNNDVKIREDLYFAYTDMLRSVKNDRYKLIEYRTDNLKKTQLFDIVNDADEVNDLYGDEEYQEIVGDLRDLLFKYRDLWDDKSHRLGKKYWERY